MKSMGKCRKDESIIEGFSLRSSKRQPANTDNCGSLSRSHKRSGENINFDSVFKIALGILIAFAI